MNKYDKIQSFIQSNFDAIQKSFKDLGVNAPVNIMTVRAVFAKYGETFSRYIVLNTDVNVESGAKDFKEKTDDEIANLSDADKTKYYKELAEWEKDKGKLTGDNITDIITKGTNSITSFFGSIFGKQDTINNNYNTSSESNSKTTTYLIIGGIVVAVVIAAIFLLKK